MNCSICPRNCNINRFKTAGFCGQKKLRISKVMLHHYEEPIISGTKNQKGSGAIFFTGCNLRCIYCQNTPISHNNKGKNISIGRLVKIIKKLEKKGALNINFVTPTHFTSEIIQALKIYKPKIPVVWNTGGYEKVETLKQLKDYVDIYLVDMKYYDNELAKRYSKAYDYPQINQQAIIEMKHQQPKDVITNGVMQKGVIIRHLVLPNNTKDSIECLKFIAKLDKDSIVSIMSQYQPRYKAKECAEINRNITKLEYKRVVNYALKLGLNNAYTQDLSSADSKYTPKF